MEHRLYDKTLKELFSRPETVRDFIKGFVDSDFIGEIDFDSMEKRNTSYITKTFKDRYTDLVIKLNLKGGACAYLYLLFEFQSTMDRLMPLRILNYMLLLYEDLIKQNEISPDELLPPVFPVVLYTGTSPYNVSTRLDDLIAMPYRRLRKYVPDFEHYLVTLQSKPREELKRLTRLDNLIAGFFYLLTARTREELKEAEQLVSDRIDFASEFGRFYVIWLRKYLKHKGIKIQTHEREGGKIMLETLVSSIKAEGKAEGKAEVKEEIARNLKRMGLKESVIAEAIGLSVEEIEKL